MSESDQHMNPERAKMLLQTPDIIEAESGTSKLSSSSVTGANMDPVRIMPFRKATVRCLQRQDDVSAKQEETANLRDGEKSHSEKMYSSRFEMNSGDNV